MDLHEKNCKLAPFSTCDLVSATDYAAAMHLQGNFSWKRAAKTALVKLNRKVLHATLNTFMHAVSCSVWSQSDAFTYVCTKICLPAKALTLCIGN